MVVPVRPTKSKNYSSAGSKRPLEICSPTSHSKQDCCQPCINTRVWLKWEEKEGHCHHQTKLKSYMQGLKHTKTLTFLTKFLCRSKVIEKGRHESVHRPTWRIKIRVQHKICFPAYGRTVTPRYDWEGVAGNTAQGCLGFASVLAPSGIILLLLPRTKMQEKTGLTPLDNWQLWLQHVISGDIEDSLAVTPHDACRFAGGGMERNLTERPSEGLKT